MRLAFLVSVGLVLRAAPIDLVAIEPSLLAGNLHVSLEGTAHIIATQAPWAEYARSMGHQWELLAGLVLVGVGPLWRVIERRFRL